LFQGSLAALLLSNAAPADAGGISWTATRSGPASAFNRQTTSSTNPGGGTYNGPGDTTGGGASGPPTGMSYYGSVCSPLDSQICVYDVWIWSYVVAGLQDGFTFYSGCHAFSEETLLMQSFYSGSGWPGYPAVTCNNPSSDIYGDAQYSHYAVPCSSTNPRGLTNAMVLDLGADVISTTNLMDLCDLEVDAGLQ